MQRERDLKFTTRNSEGEVVEMERRWMDAEKTDTISGHWTDVMIHSGRHDWMNTVVPQLDGFQLVSAERLYFRGA